MRHEKTFIRNDKTKARIIVDLDAGGYSQEIRWEVTVMVCLPRKRTYQSIADKWSYTWRNKPQAERDIEIAKFVTPEEVHETKLELWNMIRPHTPLTPTAPEP